MSETILGKNRKGKRSGTICLHCQLLYAQIMIQVMHKMEYGTIINSILHLQNLYTKIIHQAQQNACVN